jgi:4-hydroxy-tetrahydrodipicolinate reductase
MSTATSESQSDKPRSLNLALLGYGKMGRAVAELAPERGFEVRLVLTGESNRHGAGISASKLDGIDVCMDFTNPSVVVENIRGVAQAGKNLVVGTTGWHERLAEVRGIVEAGRVGLVYAANFSIGVQWFYRLASAAAEIFALFPAYEPYLSEAHHRAKKDAPSGTALELKRQVEPRLAGRAIPITSLRAGHIPGTHELGFDSEADTIILRHTARGRRSFAEGALYAARWVVGKKGLFSFTDVLENQ